MGLISIMLLSTALAGCPSKCICWKNAVKCSEKSLMNVPNFQRLENNPTIIDLSANEIDFIAYDDLSFDKAEFVHILYLNNSKIIDVDDTAFKELISVEIINLSENLLGDLLPNTFLYNTKLIFLDLSKNLFRIMPKLVSSSLESLILTNSGIQKVENDNFAQLPNLKYLNLQRNNIKMVDLETFKYLPKLNLIELEFNRWKCTCQSVELFNYLQENDVLDIKKPIQCKSNTDVFITFFTENGTSEPIKELCENSKNDLSYNFVGNYLEPKEIFNQRRSAENQRKMTKENNQKIQKSEKNETNTATHYQIIKKQNEENLKTKCKKNFDNIPSFTITNYIIFFVAVILAFIVGLASGCLFVGSSSNKRKDSSSSSDSLLKGNILV